MYGERVRAAFFSVLARLCGGFGGSSFPLSCSSASMTSARLFRTSCSTSSFIGRFRTMILVRWTAGAMGVSDAATGPLGREGSSAWGWFVWVVRRFSTIILVRRAGGAVSGSGAVAGLVGGAGPSACGWLAWGSAGATACGVLGSPTMELTAARKASRTEALVYRRARLGEGSSPLSSPSSSCRFRSWGSLAAVAPSL